MTKMTEENKSVKNFPNLRFPGFEGSWTSIKIENIAPLQRGFDLPSQNIVSGNIPIVYSNGILKFHNESKCTAPGLVTGRSGTIGKFTFLEEGAYWPHNTSLWVTNFFDNDPKFIYYLYHTINIENFSTGSGVPTLNRNDVHNQICNIPAAKEQKKISSFLTSIDNRISTQKKIIEQLETLMNASREKIFSQKLRFKDERGNYFTDWKLSKLGNLGMFFSGGTPLTSNRKYYQGNIPFIKSGEINSVESEQFISEEALKNSSAKMVNVGDILYALYGATSGEVGMSKLNGAINQAILCIRTELNNLFLLNYLKLKKQNILNTYLQGGQGNLSSEIIKSLSIPIPDCNEQIKIANFLSSIQEKIETEKQVLEKLELQKKFFLAYLFV